MAYAQPAAALAGKWTYRSFLNDPTLIGDDPNTAPANLYALLFAEAVFTFEIPNDTTLTGAIDWTGGGLVLKGTIRPDRGGTLVEIVGNRRPHTRTRDTRSD